MSANIYTLDMGDGRTLTLVPLSFRESVRVSLLPPGTEPPKPPEGYTLKAAIAHIADFAKQYEQWRYARTWEGIVRKVARAAQLAQDSSDVAPEVRDNEFVQWGDLASASVEDAATTIWFGILAGHKTDTAIAKISEAAGWLDAHSTVIDAKAVEAEAEMFRGDGERHSTG